MSNIVIVRHDLPNPTRIAADAAVSGSPCTVWAIQLNGGTDDTSIELTNDANGAGTNVIEVDCPHSEATFGSKGTVFIDYTPVGGIKFSSKCYADITGTAAVAYVWHTA